MRVLRRLRAQLIVYATILLAFAAMAAVAQGDVFMSAGGRAPVQIHVPPGYADGIPAPLVLLLHGYGSNARRIEQYVQLTPKSDENGFLLALPNGLVDGRGRRYWNGTDACCDYNRDTNDSGYLRALIDRISESFTVDPRRVFVIGHSNGGFMAHRMACDHAESVAAIASLGGDTWADVENCRPSEPVVALEIHGTVDAVVAYGGGCFIPGYCYPSAPATAADWALLNHCASSEVGDHFLDLTEDVSGPDTDVLVYGDCDEGGGAELWTIHAGRHHPVLSASFDDTVLQYLFAHPKPSRIACADVESLEATCSNGGTLVAELRLTDTRYQDTTVDMEVDGELSTVSVTGQHAQAVLTDREPGMHRVNVAAPAGCVEEVEVSCEQ